MKKNLTVKKYVMRRSAAPLIWDCNGGASQQWTTLPVS
jgi:hypothetical protein